MESKKRKLFLEILNSKLIILFLIFGVFFLTVVFAGDIIFKEGNSDISGNVSIGEDTEIIGNFNVDGSTTLEDVDGKTITFDMLTPIVYNTGNNQYYYKLGTLSGDGARVHLIIQGQNTYSSALGGITYGAVYIGNADNEYDAWQYQIGDAGGSSPTVIYKDEGEDTEVDVYVKLGTYFKGSVTIVEGVGFTLGSAPTTAVSDPSGTSATDVFQVHSTLYADGIVSAEIYVDRTPYPISLEDSYKALESMEGVDGKVDKEKLSPLLKVGEDGRDLSMTVSVLVDVIKDIVKKVFGIEEEIENFKNENEMMKKSLCNLGAEEWC